MIPRRQLIINTLIILTLAFILLSIHQKEEFDFIAKMFLALLAASNIYAIWRP
jgi:hypothetical protein